MCLQWHSWRVKKMTSASENSSGLKVLDLFSGIGGFSLGLERTGGFKTVAFCEIEPYCQAVLRKHWPEVPIYDDVSSLSVGRLAADGIFPDVIVGGFPCQDVSLAGKRDGIEGARSGLWQEMARLIGEIRPRFVIVENVAGLLSDGMGVVLGKLAALRFDAEWHSIPAFALGADHERDRVWIVAYPESVFGEEVFRFEPNGNLSGDAQARHSAYANGSQGPVWKGFGPHAAEELATLKRSGQRLRPWDRGPFDDGEVDDGLSTPVDALDAYGNAVVPQIPEIIGNAILASLGDGK